jgi:hypothetical protein
MTPRDVGILDTLFDGPAGRWVSARETMAVADMYFEALIFGGEDNDDKEYPGLIPGREADSMGCDLSDWNGISLEFRGYEGEPPTPEEAAAIFALGFTVIRIDYKDRERWTRQHKFHGDWSCVKGEAPHVSTPMKVGVDQCPTHFMCSGPTGEIENGQCALRFGHEGAHQHAVTSPRVGMGGPGGPEGVE